MRTHNYKYYKFDTECWFWSYRCDQNDCFNYFLSLRYSTDEAGTGHGQSIKYFVFPGGRFQLRLPMSINIKFCTRQHCSAQSPPSIFLYLVSFKCNSLKDKMRRMRRMRSRSIICWLVDIIIIFIDCHIIGDGVNVTYDTTVLILLRIKHRGIADISDIPNARIW